MDRILPFFLKIVQTMVKINFETESFMKTGCSGINAVSLGMSGQPQKNFNIIRTCFKMDLDYHTLPWLTLYPMLVL